MPGSGNDLQGSRKRIDGAACLAALSKVGGLPTAGGGQLLFHLRQEGPLPCDKIAPDEKGQYKNFLCTARHVGMPLAQSER